MPLRSICAELYRFFFHIWVLFFSFFSGYEWIGWRNDTPGLLGKPVEIVFEFDTIRNFSAIVLHTNNMFTKDVQVSSEEFGFIFPKFKNIYS